jgi:predicted DNA-binding protein with PD1-like motif
MKIKSDGNLLFVVMEKGERVAANLKAIAASPLMKATGAVFTAVGMIKDVVIGYGNYKNLDVFYEKTTVKEPQELLGISGFILKNEAICFHLHATLGNERREATGAHLFDAEVVTFVEMCVLMRDVPIRRILKDGLPEMDFSDEPEPGND